MTGVTPHFMRCAWCGVYFEADPEASKGQPPTLPCCPSCAAVPDVATAWHPCPICHQPVSFRLWQQLNPGKGSLDIHILHIREQQQRKALRQYRWAGLLHGLLSNLDANAHNVAKTDSKSTVQKGFSLKFWYPESTDCGKLFWYSYTLC